MERHLIIEGGLFLQGEKPGILDDGDEERVSGALDRLDEGFEADLRRPQVLRLCADGVCGTRGDAVVLGGERDCHSLKGRADALSVFMIGV